MTRPVVTHPCADDQCTRVAGDGMLYCCAPCADASHGVAVVHAARCVERKHRSEERETMTTPDAPHVIVLSYVDGSGIQGIWGPYPSGADATGVLAELKTWPGLSDQGDWSITKLIQFNPRPATVYRSTPEGGTR